MHEINLDKYELRTDLVIDHFPGEESCSNYTKKVINKDIYVEEVSINNQEEAKTFRKKEGIYKTVTFKDISDSLDTSGYKLWEWLQESIKKDN